MNASATSLTGEWTIHAIAQHREVLLQLVEAGETAFDASGVSEMDTAGLQLLLSARRSIALRGQEMHLTRASGVVQAVLSDYGLDLSLHPLVNEGESA